MNKCKNCGKKRVEVHEFACKISLDNVMLNVQKNGVCLTCLEKILKDLILSLKELSFSYSESVGK